MYEPTLYQINNRHQRRDAAEALAEYAGRMRWRTSSRVLDVGCGDGGVTVQVLRPHLPPGAQLDACDISPEMVRHAREHHSDANVNFRLADVAVDPPDDMLGRYDHVFSFYALHWVQQQRKAMSNIASMLTPGGDCLLVFLGHVPVFDEDRLMAAKPAWAEVMVDVEQFVCPYNDCKLDAQCRFRDLLLSSGFHHVNVDTKHKEYVYEGVECFKKAMQAVSPFNRRLDPKQQERFLDDFVDVFRDMGLLQPMKINGEDDITVRCEYMLIVAHAVK